MHICDYGVEVDISIIHACILKFKRNIHESNIIILHYTGNKFLQSGLKGNKYNKYNKITTDINIITTDKYNNNNSINHATLQHAVHYVTLQNTDDGHLSGSYSTTSDQD